MAGEEGAIIIEIFKFRDYSYAVISEVTYS